VTVWSYGTRSGGRSEAPLNWCMGAYVAVLTEEVRSMVALWRKIDGDGSTPATGAGQVDSLMWGSYPGLLLAGRSGHARGNRRGVARRFLCTRTEVKREGEGERGRHGRATQRRRVGEGGGVGACGAQAGGRGSIGRQDAGAVAAVAVGRHDRACDHWGGVPLDKNGMWVGCLDPSR
jgi:hypothetical protein